MMYIHRYPDLLCYPGDLSKYVPIGYFRPMNGLLDPIPSSLYVVAGCCYRILLNSENMG